MVPLFFICKHTDALITSVTGRPAFSYFSILGVQKKNSEGSWENAVSCLAPSGRSLKNERYFEKDGKIYHHILNPFTGYPYETHLQQVTIISDASVDGDALSTTCFTLGLEEGSKLIKSLDEIEAIFVTDDGNIHRVG